MTTINGYEIAGRMPMFTAANRDLVRRGLKTQTRRIVKQNSPRYDTPEGVAQYAFERIRDGIASFRLRHGSGWHTEIKCPYGKPGDIRVMPEPLLNGISSCICYSDQDELGLHEYIKINGEFINWRWKNDTLSSMFMPTALGRTLVRYTDIRVERLQDISGEDAIAEGIDPDCAESTENYNNYATGSVYKDAFAELWDSINAKKHPWSSNPWVWIVEWELLG